MRLKTATVTCVVGLFALAAVAGVQGQGPDVIAITGATLIDGTMRAPVADAVIVIEGSRIRAAGPRSSTVVPPGAMAIDAAGKFVIPGLADMHHHLQSGAFGGPQNLRLNLQRLLAVGITTVFDPSVSIADFAALRSAAADETGVYPRFFSSGPLISVPGDFLAAQVGSPTPASPEAAAAAVRMLKDAGVDAIKVQRDDFSWATNLPAGIMRTDVLESAVREAHAQGLRVFAHAPLLAHATEALRAGVDGLMHGIIDQPVDQTFIDLMKKNGASYVATMALFEDVADPGAWARRQSEADRIGYVPAAIYQSVSSDAGVQQFQALFSKGSYTRNQLPVARANLKTVFDAGIPVVMGTDTGFPGVLLGIASHLELALLVEAGLTPADALRAATLNAARMIGRDKDIGTVEPGKAADLLILDADPLRDIRATMRIHRVLKGGVVRDPQQLLQSQ